MKLIVGLGNPGARYEQTRHNVGWMILDEVARRNQIDVSRLDRDFQALVGEGFVGGERCLLCKPTTYMNLSGRSVAAVQRFYKLANDDVFVLSDDVDLPVGRIRIRATGSAGGQKGLADILKALGTQDVARLRMGIGRVDPRFTSEYVLSRFDGRDRETIEPALWRAADAVACWARRGVEAAMNEYNRKTDE